MKWLYLALAIATEVTATLALRAAIDNPIWFIVVAVGYGLSFVMLSRVLIAGMPIGVAYGIWSAVGVSITAVAAAVLFSDPLTIVMGLGIVLVMAGVLLVEMGSHPRAKVTTGDAVLGTSEASAGIAGRDGA